MTTEGTDMKHAPDAEKVFRVLKPAELDRLADEGYARHRDSDLARISMTSPIGHRRRRLVLPRFLAAALVAGVAASAVVIVSAQHDDPRPTASRGATATPSTLDARSFLLASAETAEKAPARTGNYWYTRERTTQWTTQAWTLKGSKTLHLSSPGVFASTQETWLGRGPHTRTIIGIDTKTTIAPADQAKWKAFGPATLELGIPSKPKVSDYNMQMHLQIGNKQVTMAELAKLPTTEKGLEAELRRRYRADMDDPYEKSQLKAIHSKPPTFVDSIWGTAQDLLAGPISPGTRAALYRVLADQPEIKMIGTVTDSLGRRGVALAVDHAPHKLSPNRTIPGSQERLVIDPQSAQLLEHASYRLNANGQVEQIAQSDAYQAMGWTNKIDQRP